MSYLTSARIHLPEGMGEFILPLDKGLTFLSGENGTGKSKTLELIKNQAADVGNTVETSDSQPIPGDRIAFYNPKRNSQKKEVEGLIEQLQREGKSARSVQSLVNQNYSDQQFVEYPSVAELYALSVDDIMKSKNKAPSKAVEIIGKEMQLVLEKVMPTIKVEADWNSTQKQATLWLTKYGKRIRPSQLSVGENEVIALAVSIYLYRDSHDIYLIDEPEAHLNWSLEQKLFEFLRWFSREEKKQVVVATHSPIVFEKDFEVRTKFFSWNKDRVELGGEPTTELTKKLASRVAATVQTIETKFDKTFFVEDKGHQVVVEKLAFLKGKNINVVPVEGRAKVIALHAAIGDQMSKAEFMVDGDNDDAMNSAFTGQLFALDKYCIENYFLIPEVLARVSTKPAYSTVPKTKKLLIDKTLSHPNATFKKQNKANIIVAGSSPSRFWEIIDSIDGSWYLKGMKIWQQLGFRSKESFMNAYIEKCQELDKLDSVFGEITGRF